MLSGKTTAQAASKVSVPAKNDIGKRFINPTTNYHNDVLEHTGSKSSRLFHLNSPLAISLVMQLRPVIGH